MRATMDPKANLVKMHGLCSMRSTIMSSAAAESCCLYCRPECISSLRSLSQSGQQRKSEGLAMSLSSYRKKRSSSLLWDTCCDTLAACRQVIALSLNQWHFALIRVCLYNTAARRGYQSHYLVQRARDLCACITASVFKSMIYKVSQKDMCRQPKICWSNTMPSLLPYLQGETLPAMSQRASLMLILTSSVCLN